MSLDERINRRIIDLENLDKDRPKYYRNPLARSKVRNYPCICGSGKKLKKCHGFKAHLKEGEEVQEVQELLLIWERQQLEKGGLLNEDE